MSAVASACANPVAESFLICANYSSALYSAGVGMCGNNDSIEKHLFCRGGQNHEGFAEIANIAMMEFAAHFNYPFRISGDGVHVGRKSKAAISFQDSCKYFAGVFISGPARITYVRRRPVGEEPFQILLRFMESAQKSFQTQIRNPNPARPSYFSAISHYFPPFPVSEFFQTSMESGKECFARCV